MGALSIFWGLLSLFYSASYSVLCVFEVINKREAVTEVLVKRLTRNRESNGHIKSASNNNVGQCQAHFAAIFCLPGGLSFKHSKIVLKLWLMGYVF